MTDKPDDAATLALIKTHFEDWMAEIWEMEESLHPMLAISACKIAVVLGVDSRTLPTERNYMEKYPE